MIQKVKNICITATFIVLLTDPVIAQDVGNCGSTCSVGEYVAGTNLFVNNVPSHAITGSADFNLMGGSGHSLNTSAGTFTSNSLIYGQNHIINDSRHSILIGDDNDVFNANASGALGEDNIVSANSSFAIGEGNDVNANKAIGIGVGNEVLGRFSVAAGREISLQNEGNYGVGREIVIDKDDAIAIGFGDPSSGQNLTDVGTRTITLGVDANNTLNIFNGAISINTTSTPQNDLDISGNAVIGSGYAGNNSAPTDGLLVEGDVGIGTTSPSTKLSVEGVITPASHNTYDLGSGSSPQLEFVDVNITGQVNNSSDRRMKEQIETLKYGLDEILKLKPISYLMKSHPEKGEKLGLIAQEVENHISEVVTTYNGEKKMKALAYSRLIPVLINGMQEQQQQIRQKDQKILNLQQQVNQQEEKIDNMQKRLARLEKAVFNKREKRQTDSEKSGTGLEKKARLSQNVPNPFDQTTIIDYYLPESVDNARLVIANTNGNVVKEFHLDQPGKGSVQVEGGTLNPGTYPYYLVTDGQRVAGRKLTIIRR